MAEKDIRKAYKHPDKPGAGAKARRKLRGMEKVHAVMGEFKRGTLRSGSGEKVTKREQAVAIAMSEAGLAWPSKMTKLGKALRAASKKR